jgi:hypothetical protein
MQVDSSYHAYAHHDSNGNIMPYTYLPIYNGWVDSNGRLRSLSGKAPKTMQTGEVQIAEPRSNNPSDVNIWDIEKFVDHNLITLLLMLISRTTNSQAAFGNGLSGNNSSVILSSGTMNDKGLFWGSTSTITSGVKVFGIEHWWGNIWRRHMGIMLSSGVAYYKLTKGTEDGSRTNGFNMIDISGYSEPYGWINSGIGYSESYLASTWIKFIRIGADGSIIPIPTSGAATITASSSTYLCDYLWWYTNTNTTPLFGGNPGLNQGQSGTFGCSGNYDLQSYADTVGASISCKPEVS